MASAHPDFNLPLLGPDFAKAVGLVREDARVAILRDNDTAVGFLPHHRRPGGASWAIGAPFSDYHALVSDRRLPAGEALAAADLGSWRFTSLIDPFNSFEGQVSERHDGFVMAFESGAEAYLEALRAASAKRFKNYRRLEHKMARELGEVTVRAPDTSLVAFERLIAWKREQLARTGVHDFLGPTWTRALMRSLFETRTGEFQGLMINLYAGGELIAGHFGVRLGDRYHPWIASTHPDMGAWSPGQVFLLRAIGAMPSLNLTSYDLGPSHDHYKRPFSLALRPVGAGVAVADGPAGRSAQLAERAWTLAGAHRGGAVDSLRRRLDAINTAELTFAGRARGLALAVAARARRASGSAAIE